MITGYEFAERLFSDGEYKEERIYSTGDPNLDELLERAFCDGYEYAQHEYSHETLKGLGLSLAAMAFPMINGTRIKARAASGYISREYKEARRGGGIGLSTDFVNKMEGYIKKNPNVAPTVTSFNNESNFGTGFLTKPKLQKIGKIAGTEIKNSLTK